MSNTYTNKRRRGRPPTVVVEQSDDDCFIDMGLASIDTTTTSEPEHNLTLQDRAIKSLSCMVETPQGCERWAIAYKQAGSILMYQYELDNGTYQLVDLFDWLLSRGKILFGEIPKIGDIIFLQSNGYMYSGKIVKTILEVNLVVTTPPDLPVWMIDSYVENTRGMHKKFEVTAYDHDSIITQWYAIARIDK